MNKKNENTEKLKIFIEFQRYLNHIAYIQYIYKVS